MIFFDLETHLIAKGRLAPPIVCGAFAWSPGDPSPSRLWDRDETLSTIAGYLEGGFSFVGHNVAYDFGCIVAARPDLLPAVFSAYEEDRVTDTMIRQELIDIAHGCHGKLGRYGLADLSARLLDRPMEKADTWRLRYAELDGIPLDQWPEAARTYPLLDVTTTRDVFEVQEREAPPEYLVDQYAQARAAWALHLLAAWGVTTDPVAVERLAASLGAERDEIEGRLVKLGWLERPPTPKRGASAGIEKPYTRKMARVGEAVKRAYSRSGRETPETETGKVSTDALTCRESGDPDLERYARLSEVRSRLDKNVPVLREGLVHTRFGLAASGRSTSKALEGGGGDNLQNQPRKGGIRECFVPRPGFVFVDVDYSTLELCTLAQVCVAWFGESALADAINAGRDVHRELGTEIAGCAYEDVTDDTRQTAKVANFGFPGGLSPGALVGFALGTYGVRMTFDQAVELKAAWMRRWPEMAGYFATVDRLVKAGGRIEHLYTGRLRGRCGFTDGCNTFFQALGADIAKRAMWLVSRAAYTDLASALFGCRPVMFVHDQILTEAPEATAHEAALAQETLMLEAARPLLPDVPGTKVSALLTRRYSKSAKRIVDPSTGRLVPWDV